MTTTKEKTPKASKPKAPAKPKAPEPDAPATLAPSNIVPIPFARIKRAPENVRKTNVAADVESLADDIAAHGLLQSLIGYAGNTEIDKNVVWIVGGGRRLQALQLLHERGVIDDHWPVSVLIRDQSEAIELSLSENLARRDMNPADEFEAFAALLKTGATNPAQLGKRFGFTERYVKQRLRLAALAPDILEALRNDVIGVESAVAYAHATDQNLQLKIFKQNSRPNAYNGHSASNIKWAYQAEQMSTSDPIFMFIDPATYENEGGDYDDDLFGAVDGEADRKLTNASLAMTIATRCAELQAIRLLTAEREKHPSIADFVMPKGLKIGQVIEPPSGHVEIKRGHDWRLNVDVDMGKVWSKIDKLEVQAIIALHIDTVRLDLPDDADEAMRARLLKEGTTAELKVDESRVFVPSAVAKQLLPAPRSTSYGDNLTPEQRDEQELKREGRVWAARLAVPKLSEIEGFEGRVFYDRDWLDNHKRMPGALMTDDPTPSFAVTIFVTEDEIVANLDAGIERAKIERAEAARIRAAREAEKAAAEQAQQDARDAAIAEINALPHEPEVVEIEHGYNNIPEPHFRQEDGSYHHKDEVVIYDSLGDMLEDAESIGRYWLSSEAWHADDAELVDEGTEDA